VVARCTDNHERLLVTIESEREKLRHLIERECRVGFDFDEDAEIWKKEIWEIGDCTDSVAFLARIHNGHRKCRRTPPTALQDASGNDIRCSAFRLVECRT
jgi:hypothetical protein